MVGKRSAMGKGARFPVIAVLLYIVETVVILTTAADRDNGYVSVLMGTLTSAFGAGLAAAALRTDYLKAMWLRWRLRGRAEHATATVAAAVSFHNSEFTYPVFEYATPDGVTHRYGDASSRALAVGSTADVRYLAGEADFAVGPLSRFNAVVFLFLAVLGVVLSAMMPVMTVQALVS